MNGAAQVNRFLFYIHISSAQGGLTGEIFIAATAIMLAMQTALTLDVLLSLLLAVALGAIVGIEREITHKPAGLRTHMLVSLGACLFTVVSIGFSFDPARIAAGIVAGIGFIGAGTIWAEKDKVQGITTAASLWATAAIGLTAGMGDYPLAIAVTILVFIILASNSLLKRIGLEKE